MITASLYTRVIHTSKSHRRSHGVRNSRCPCAERMQGCSRFEQPVELQLGRAGGGEHSTHTQRGDDLGLQGANFISRPVSGFLPSYWADRAIPCIAALKSICVRHRRRPCQGHAMGAGQDNKFVLKQRRLARGTGFTGCRLRRAHSSRPPAAERMQGGSSQP